MGLCNDEAKEVLEYLRLGEQQVQSTTQKNIIFVLGSTGTGNNKDNAILVSLKVTNFSPINVNRKDNTGTFLSWKSGFSPICFK